MKKGMLVVLLAVSASMFAQKDVTKFMGIPGHRLFRVGGEYVGV